MVALQDNVYKIYTSDLKIGDRLKVTGVGNMVTLLEVERFDGYKIYTDLGMVLISPKYRIVMTEEQIPLALTALDWKLLTALLEGKGEILTHSHLVRAIWGADVDKGYTNQLRVQIARLRDALGGGIITVNKIGYGMRSEIVGEKDEDNVDGC